MICGAPCSSVRSMGMNWRDISVHEIIDEEGNLGVVDAEKWK